MGSQVKRSDIAEDDIFKNIRDSAKATIVELEKINAEFKQTATTLEKGLSGAKTDTSKGLKEFNTTLEHSNKLTKEAVQINQELEKARALKAKADQEIEKISQQKLRTTQMQTTADQKLLKEEQKLAKEEEKRLKVQSDQANAYKQLSINTAELKSRAKQLSAEMYNLELAGKKDTKEFREMAKSLKEVSLAANQGDQALKKIDKSVGDNFRNVGNYEGAVNKLRNGLGQLGLAFGIGSVVSSAGKTIVEFDQKIADLISITGAGGKDLEFFKQQSLEMGKSVEGGASAVIEAYKLIGSARPELLSNAQALDEVTKSAITLSQASGMTLPESATALTSALNQFGAPASEATRYMDALANGALLGSIEIPGATDALLKFGGVAKSSNISVEESVALIQALGPSFKSTEELGTGLRNVMLKLSAPDALPKEAQEAMRRLGVNFEQVTNKAIPFSERLEAMKPLLKDEAALIKVFGEGNIIAAKAALTNTDAISKLTDGMDKQGTTSEQAKARTNTLQFALNSLKETWNSLVLSFANGEGSSQFLINSLKFIADNLGTIVSWVGKAVIAWASYKALQKSIQLGNFLMSGGLKTVATNMLEVFKAGKKAGEGAQAVGDGMTKAGKAMSAVPWIAIIGLAIELATSLYDVASGAKAAREQQELLRQADAAAEKNISSITKEAKDYYDEKIRLLNNEIRERKTAGENAKKLDEEQARREEQIANDAKKRIQNNVKVKKTAMTETIRMEEILRDKIANLGNVMSEKQIQEGREYQEFIKKTYGSTREELIKNTTDYDAVLQKLIARESRLTTEIVGLSDAQKEFNDLIDEAKIVQKEVNIQTEDNTSKITAKIPKMKELNIEYEKTNEYLTIQTELLNELSEIENERAVKKAETDVQTQVSVDVANISNGGTVQAGESSQYLLFEELINKKYDLITKFEADRLLAEINGINERYRLMDLAEIQSAKERRDKLLEQEGLTDAQKPAINQQYANDLKMIEDNNLQRNADRLLENEIAEGKSKDKLVQLEVDKNNEINSENDKIIDAEIAAAQKKSDEISKITTDGAKKNYETERQFIKLASDYFIKRSNDKIAQYDKEIQKAETLYSSLQTMAENGNITAKESLAEQQKLIVEANRKKEQEQRRQERIKLAESVYSTYTANVEKNEPNPLAKTITDITLLNQFISSLPTFYEGTEGTVSEALGMPQLSGRDGHIVRVDGSEKILNPKLSAMTGNLSTNEIAKIAMEYNNGKLINKGDGAVQLNTGWSAGLIVKKLEDLTSIIQNKPETNIQLGEIIQGTMSIIKSQKKGNSVVYNKFRVK